ncbi:hypothetical protein OH77DRAFT_1418860 [Trametes cingulata]|nr:hypothetical protein OH77DRAFT_1418860 [Trametes cingulata]
MSVIGCAYKTRAWLACKSLRSCGCEGNVGGEDHASFESRLPTHLPYWAEIASRHRVTSRDSSASRPPNTRLPYTAALLALLASCSLRPLPFYNGICTLLSV